MAKSEESKKRIVITGRRHVEFNGKKSRKCANTDCGKRLTLGLDVVLLTQRTMPDNDYFGAIVTCSENCADEVEHKMQQDSDKESGVKD